jgi:hypothetical protein
MRKLIVFNQVTLDGYIADINGDMSWVSLPRTRSTTKSGQFTGASKSRGSCTGPCGRPQPRPRSQPRPFVGKNTW